MSITIEVSLGEFLDKMTILEIKSERITDRGKLKNVKAELSMLDKIWAESEFVDIDITSELAQLKSTNEKLWDIEDRIRIKESQAAFDEEFIELARSIYITNDERAVLKRRLNEMLGSELVEEKSYSTPQRSRNIDDFRGTS